MRVKALQSFHSETLGYVPAGREVDAPDHLAMQMMASGYLEAVEYETKVVHNVPQTPKRRRKSREA